MKRHPIVDYSYRWIPMLLLALVLVVAQVALLRGYAGTDYLPAVIDAIATVGWLMALFYLVWLVVNYVSLFQAEIVIVLVGILVWLGGCFMVNDVMSRIVGIPYISFAMTIPFRLLFGIPAWIAMLLWHRLVDIKEEITDQENEEETLRQLEGQADNETQEEVIDRITVKDGSRIHLIEVEELLYIQACGDYVTLITPTGEYIKEQTMKYFENHLPLATFVRVHRSTIVNVTQISRVELFGKETYQLSLKNGIKLRVSLSGYRLLKERLGI